MGYERPPYYLTAYGIAVKHGYEGTEEEWIQEIRGDAAESAAAAAESAAEAADAAREVVGDLTDGMGSTYQSAAVMQRNIEAATRLPLYSFSFTTTGRILPGDTIIRRRSTTPIHVGKNALLQILMSDEAKALVDDGWTLAFWKGDMVGETFSNPHSLNVTTTELCNYSYFHPEQEWLVITLTSPSGTLNTVEDLNGLVTVTTKSPYCGIPSIAYEPRLSMQPYIVRDNAIVLLNSTDSSDSDEDEGDDDEEETDPVPDTDVDDPTWSTNRTWGLKLETEGLRRVWSDAVGFDYALTDIDGNILQTFTDHYKLNCLDIPDTVSGTKVAFVYLNFASWLRLDGTTAAARLYDAAPWLKHIYLEYDDVSREAAPNYASSVVLENVRTIMNLNPYTGAVRRLYRRRPTSKPSLTGTCFPGAMYRPRLRNNLGPCVSWHTYLSCLDGYSSLAIASHSAGEDYWDEAGYYGMVCATFLANVYGSRLFLSTTTTWAHYGPDGLNKMTELSDVSECRVGDLIYWDGSNTERKSNHAAIVADRIFVRGSLRYVVIAEAADDGVRYSRISAPFDPHRNEDIRQAYRLRSEDLGFVPPRIAATDVWTEGEADLLTGRTDAFATEYASGIPFTRVLPSTLTMRSTWGDRHNTQAGNEQRIIFSHTAAGTPYDTLTLQVKNGDAYEDVDDWNIEDLLADEDTGADYAFFNAAYVLAPEGTPRADGWYRIVASGTDVDEAVCDLYYYEHALEASESGGTLTVDIGAIVTEASAGNVLIRHRVFDPEGSVRTVAQYAWLPLQDYIDAGAYSGGILTLETEDDTLLDVGCLVFNAYGACEYVFTEGT